MARRPLMGGTGVRRPSAKGVSNGSAPHFAEMVANALAARQEWMRQYEDRRRNIDAECDYPEMNEGIDVRSYRELYDREPIPARVVDVMPRETWQVHPEVYEDEDPEVMTEFEKSLQDLGKQLCGRQSWFEGPKANSMWEYLIRADRLSGVGSFGILLLGFDDGRPLYEPVRGTVDVVPMMSLVSREPTSGSQVAYVGPNSIVPDSTLAYPIGTEQQYWDFPSTMMEMPSTTPSGKETKLLFIRAYDESLVTISRYESNEFSPRFGHPLQYQITVNDPRENKGGIGAPTATLSVHWTRVIHLADNLNASEIFGAPRMRPVYNRLLDLRKLYGGSAEMYWQGALPGLAFEADPAFADEGEIDTDSEGLQDTIEQYMHGLKRYLDLNGYKVKSLAPQVVDPSAHIEKQIEAICIQIGCPVRVFKGSERGELASSQDDAAWNDRLRHRQSSYVTPRIILPFIDRLISAGVLPQPKHYCVEWPDLTSQTPQERSAVTFQRTQALVQYVKGMGDLLVSPMDYLIYVMGFEERVAKMILGRANKGEQLKRPAPVVSGGVGAIAGGGEKQGGSDPSKPGKDPKWAVGADGKKEGEK